MVVEFIEKRGLQNVSDGDRQLTTGKHRRDLRNLFDAKLVTEAPLAQSMAAGRTPENVPSRIYLTCKTSQKFPYL